MDPWLDEAPIENLEFLQIHLIFHFGMMSHPHRDTWKRDLNFFQILNFFSGNSVNEMHKNGQYKSLMLG